MANPCPCELVVNETPAMSTKDTSAHPSTDDDSTDDSNESIAANVQPTDKYQDLTNLYPFIRETKSLSASRKRFKRPSWATIGRRTPILIGKRPAWVTIG